jgi:peptide/nickel transport system substrate-binding protein
MKRQARFEDRVGKGLSRRGFVRGLLMGGATLAASARSGQAAAPAQSTAGGPQKGGRLVFINGSDVTNFDPSALSVGNHAFLHQIYDSLVRIDSGGSGQVSPWLAESWKWSADGKSLTFNLRGGARFHTGREITSEDVKFSLERYKKEEVAANLRPRLLPIIDVQTPTPRTAVLALDRRYPGIFDVLDQFFILNKDVIGDIRTKAAGSGLYTLAEWRPGEMFRMKRFADHWSKDAGFLDEITVRIVGDPEAQLAMLESGQADLVYFMQGRYAERLRGRADFKVFQAGLGAATHYVMVNCSREPFTNTKVRQAISHAIDRARILRTVYPGEGELGCLPWTPTHWAHDRELAARCRFDLDKAKQLLVEAGYPNGFKTTVNTAVPGYSPGSKEVAQILQQDFQKIGIDLEIKVYEAAEARKRIFSADHNMLIHNYSAAGADPSFNFPGRSTSTGKDSFMQWYNSEFDKYVAEAFSELDREKRKKSYAEVARIFLDDAPNNVTVYRYVLSGARKRVNDYRGDQSGYPDLTYTWVAP